jgi:putative ATP-binding cassette transporter
MLDEATAALDEESEAELYGLLRNELSKTAIVSIGHRSTLARLHDRSLNCAWLATATTEDRPGWHAKRVMAMSR